MTLEERMEAYKRDVAHLSEREKAIAEVDIWRMVVEEKIHVIDGRRYMRRDWLRDMLGVPIKESERRQAIFNVGAIAEPIWHEIEHNEMHPQSAAYVLSDAKRISGQERIPLEAAITQALEDYNARPLIYRLDGLIVRKREVSPKGSPRPRSLGIRAAKAKGPSHEPSHKDASLFSRIRKEVLEHVENKLSHSPAFVADSIANNFTIGLKVLMDELRRDVKNAMHLDSGFLNMTSSDRKRVLAACHTLGVPPPKVDRPVNLTLARQNWRRLAMQYHPDKDPTTAAMFLKVNDAHDTLKKYNAKIQKKESTDGNADGDTGSADVETAQ